MSSHEDFRRLKLTKTKSRRRTERLLPSRSRCGAQRPSNARQLKGTHAAKPVFTFNGPTRPSCARGGMREKPISEETGRSCNASGRQNALEWTRSSATSRYLGARRAPPEARMRVGWRPCNAGLEAVSRARADFPALRMSLTINSRA